MASEPYEIIVAPYTLYTAPVGEAFPLIDAAPAGLWVKVGALGDQNYAEEGVTVAHSQTIEKFRSVGSTGPRKVGRTEEDLTISLTLWDLTLEQYKLALNQNTVAETVAGGGAAGFKEIPLYRSFDVATFALLVRGDVSPYGGGWKSQYEVPVAFEQGSPEPVFAKGAPAGLALEFGALVDPNAASVAARFGRLVTQNATAV